MSPVHEQVQLLVSRYLHLVDDALPGAVCGHFPLLGGLTPTWRLRSML